MLLPLTFLSSAFMQLNLAPTWIRDIAEFNPVNWGAQAARSATSQTTDWDLVGTRVALLAGAAARLHGARDEGVPRLPTLDLDTCRPPSSAASVVA